MSVAEFVDEFVIAETLGVEVRTLRKWRVSGGGPPYYKLSRGNKQGMVRYRPSECVDWMASFRREHTSNETLVQGIRMRRLTCHAPGCGEFDDPIKGGKIPHYCPEHRKVPAAPPRVYPRGKSWALARGRG